MNTVSILLLCAAIAYSYLGLFALVRNHRARLHQIFFAGCLMLSGYAFCYFIMQSSVSSVDEYARLWDVSAIFWISVGPVWLHFFLEMTLREWLERHRWVLGLLYGTIVVFLLVAWTGDFYSHEFVKLKAGWHNKPDTSSPWFWAFTVFYEFCFLAAAALSWRHGREAKTLRQRRQSHVLMVSLFVTMLLMTLQNFGWPLWSHEPLPASGPLAMIFWPIGLFVAMVRYRMLAITPSTVAQEILRTMADSVLLIDAQQVVLTANRATADLFGTPERDVVGRPVRELFSDLTDTDAQFLAGIHQHPAGTQRELTTFRPEARGIPAQLSLSPIAGTDGTPEGAVVVVRDITERKRTEEQLRNVEKLVRQKKELLVNVSHELRTPLTRISIALELCEDQPSASDIKRHLGGIKGDVDELTQMITDILEVSRLELAGLTDVGDPFAPKFAPICINDLIKVCVSTILVKEPRREIVMSPDRPVGSVSGDGALIKRVMVNLLDNACKYAPEHSRIDVSSRAAGGQVEIRVENTCSPLLEKEVARLFEPFYRAEKSRHKNVPGSGLGLTLCKRIVEMHGGHISARYDNERFMVSVLLKALGDDEAVFG